ncbi:Hypothetical protein CAP_8624 [Chondromyces apiculatus DSM 436]|uniref:Uncharacterized protein n=1 Tax=Chondromyces apiculatus DSM 436 TaxID=1192034 RepID=A0A017SVZ5_9BACT|nr:Hypothetical protein CAP_8624 [Chondromyces apiculatus DSM 436]
MLAVTSREPLKVWVGQGASVKRVTLGEETQVGRTVPAYVLDAVGLADGRVLACVGPTRAPEEGPPRRARLVVLDDDAMDLDAAEEIAVPEATRVRWPGGIWAEGEVPWPEDEAEEDDEPTLLDALAVAVPLRDGAASYDPVTCSQNEHGIALAGAYAGLVVALPPGGGRPEFALRVPTQRDNTEIHATRTAAGVLVVICVERQLAAIVHLGPDGKVLAHRDKIGKDAAWGLGPPVVQGDKVLLFEAGNGGGERLHELSLADLKVTKSVEGAGKQRGELSATTGPGGAPVLLGLGDTAYVVERGGRGRVTLKALEAPAPPPPKPLPRTGPARAVGTPSLALAGPGEPRTWTIAAGETLKVKIPFTNHGGPGKGLAIEVSGPALTAGLVKPERATLGDVELPLEMKGAAARAELPDFAVPPGLLERGPKNSPLPDPAAMQARLELAGAKAGSGVLTVRLIPLGTPGGRGSVLQGKSLTVT